MLSTAPPRLPRGRHRLTRSEVEHAQRARMLHAMVEAMTKKGYVGTTVADVIRGAGVSRETFYQQFSSRLHCFLSAFDAAAESLEQRMLDSVGGDGHPLDRFERAVTRYLDSLAEQPAYDRVFLVEVYAAGPEALARRAAFQERIVDRIVDLLGTASDEGRFACEMLVAGTGALVTGPLVANDLAAVRGLRGPLVHLVRRALTVGS